MSRGAARNRWRASHRDARNRERRTNYARGAAHLSLAERACKRLWTAWEDVVILAHEREDRALARVLHRSVQAIHARRTKLVSRGAAGRSIQELVLQALDYEDGDEGSRVTYVASAVGVTVKQASGALSRLKEQGLVVFSYGSWHRAAEE